MDRRAAIIREVPSSAAAHLDRERRQAERLRADLAAELAGIIEAQVADPPDDEHDVEGSSVGFERARVTALLEATETHVRELSAAARRLDDGNYGRCEACGGSIGDERLLALPSTRRCVRCVRRAAGGAPRISGRSS